MSHERDRRERSQLQHDAEHSRPKRRTASVMGYLAILFAAAFLLLLLSYFMQQRTNEEAISGLKDSVNSFQSVGNLVEQNTALTEKNSALQQQLDELEKEAASLQQQVIDRQDDARLASKAVESMDWLWRIQRAYSKGNKNDARKLVEQFEANLLPSYLPTASDYFSEGPSPAEQYEALLAALGMQKATP